MAHISAKYVRLTTIKRKKLKQMLQIWLFMSVTMCDGLQNVNSGILRGSGLPMLAARANVLCYYGVGMPLGVFVTIKYPNLGSLWAGRCMVFALAGELLIVSL